MKKTTIRTVVSVFAAASIALLAACKQPDTPETPKPTPKPDGAPSLQGVWKVESWGSTTIDKKEGHFLHFDDKNVLKLAYDADTTDKTDASTRDAKVTYKVDTAKKTIESAELQIPAASTFELTADKMTITAGSKKMVLVKQTGTTLDFSKNKNDAAVVGAFNKLNNVMFGGSAEKGKVWQVTDIEGTDVSAKKLYWNFSDDGKITLAADSGANLKKNADAASAYSSAADKCLGAPALTLADLSLTNAKIEVMGDAGKRKATITLADGKVWKIAECDDATATAVKAFSNTIKLDDMKKLFSKSGTPSPTPQPGPTPTPQPGPNPPKPSEAKLEITWKVESWGTATVDKKDAYIIDIDANKAIKIAFESNGTVNTKMAAVTCTIDTAKKTIESAELLIPAGTKYDLTADKLTINAANKKIVLVKHTGAKPDFSKDTKPEAVIGAFNKLNKVMFGGKDEIGKVWQVKKIEGADVDAKKLYLSFTEETKLTLAANAGSYLKKLADMPSAYSSPSDKSLGVPTVTIADLSITDAKVEVKGEAGKRTAVITLADKKTWELAECAAADAAAVKAFSEKAKLAEIKGLFTPAPAVEPVPKDFDAALPGLWRLVAVKLGDNDNNYEKDKASSAYLFHFDKDKKLRLAYVNSFANNENKYDKLDERTSRRAKTVQCDISGKTIKIPELHIKDPAKYTWDKDKGTLTIEPQKKKLVLKKLKKGDQIEWNTGGFWPKKGTYTVGDDLLNLDYTKDTDASGIILQYNTLFANPGDYPIRFSGGPVGYFKISKYDGKEPGKKKDKDEKKDYWLVMTNGWVENTQDGEAKIIVQLGSKGAEDATHKIRSAGKKVTIKKSADKVLGEGGYSITVEGIWKDLPLLIYGIDHRIDGGKSFMEFQAGEVAPILKVKDDKEDDKAVMEALKTFSEKAK